MTVRRKLVERRKSRELSKDFSTSPNPPFPNGVSSSAEPAKDSANHVSRYPEFVSVNGSQAQAKQTPGQKPPGQRTRPTRSASFSTPKKPSPRGTGNQPQIRHEESDIKLGNGTSRTGSAFSRTSRSCSASSLNRNHSAVVSPRSQVTTRESPGLRREKSDGVRPRRLQAPSPRGRAQSLSLNSSSSTSSIADSRPRRASDMSKIPSLKRAPVATTQTSRIPSLTKQQQSPEDHARAPPKSKIPSIGKGEKKSQVTGREKSSQESSAAKASRIPSFSSAAGRPDSAKENQDPTVTENGGGGEHKHNDATTSRIPSFNKKSRIPALPKKEEGGMKTNETQPETFGDRQDGAQDGQKDIANDAEPRKNAKTSVSRIPSLSRTSAAKEEPKPKSNIPGPTSAPASKETPSSGLSKIAVDKEKVAPNSSKIAAKSSGIPKPGSAQTSGIPKVNGVQSHVPASAPECADTEPAGGKTSSIPQSRLPQLSRKISAGNASTSRIPALSGTRKSSETEKSVTEEKKAVEPLNVQAGEEQEANGPPQKDVEKEDDIHDVKESPNNEAELSEAQPCETQDESPTHKCIANEAKKVQQLLLEGEIVIEVPVEVDVEDEPEVEETRDEVLISDVLESYAPDLANKENVPALENTTKVNGQDTEARLSFDDIYVQAFENELAKANLQGKKAKAENSVIGDGDKTDIDVKGVQAKTTKDAELRSPDSETKGAEVPALDTLGGYEQQSRRTRSRQRKMVSDTDESENEQSTAKDDAKKGIDKDKYGISLEAEKRGKEVTKPAKSKSKGEKSKFVVESSLGKEFYESKKTESKESISGLPTATKPLDASVATESECPAEQVADAAPAVETHEAVEFEDIELNSMEARAEISRSVEDLDDKTVKCMGCGRGGKCAIM